MTKAQITSYLDRIGFIGPLAADLETLIRLHECHVLRVPFENVDVWRGKLFTLQPDGIFQKVVTSRRGGFCYELNFLFFNLLEAVGFDVHLIACRIVTADGRLGPPLDHMAIHVKLDQPHLADVGFGDLFLRPLSITCGTQSDGRNLFSMLAAADNSFDLHMADEDNKFKHVYRFDLKPVRHEEFASICHDKQTNPDSYFVKNLVCTMPTPRGRCTIFNDKLIVTESSHKSTSPLIDRQQIISALAERFGVMI